MAGRSYSYMIMFFCLEDNTPSPNSYQLPPLLGPKVPNKLSSAAYSMAYRSTTGAFSEDLAKTPGPGHYNAVAPNTYVKKAPAYSMLSRSYMPGGEYVLFLSRCIDRIQYTVITDSTQKPGPGAHSPEKVTCNKKSTPKYSLGIRHSEYVYTPHFVEAQEWLMNSWHTSCALYDCVCCRLEDCVKITGFVQNHV